MAAFLKTNSIPMEQKDIWKGVLVKEFMSSGTEDVEGATLHVMVVKPLPWRGAKASRFLLKLDDKAKKKKSKQSIKHRVIAFGENSTRPKPPLFADDFWGFGAE